MRKTVTAALGVAAALTFGLSACTEEQAYCVDLAGYAASAVGVNPTDPATYAGILDDARKLQETAPVEVRDDWGAIVAFAEKAQQAGSDRVELARLSRETGSVTAASSAIAGHAREACQVDLPALG